MMNTAFRKLNIYFVLLLFVCNAPQVVLAQKEFKFVDMHVCSSQKAFESLFEKDRPDYRRFQFVRKMEHDCESPSDIPSELKSAYDGISKRSQANLTSMNRGNVKISNQVLRPTERQFLLRNQYLSIVSEPWKAYNCLAGVDFAPEWFAQDQVDYFRLILKQLEYIKDELTYDYYDYHLADQKYKCRLIRNTQDLEEVMGAPNEIGMVISIGGGHALGNYVYISTDQHKTPEYQNVIMHNIDKLKGAIPLRLKTNEYLDIPIFSINFGNAFEDGICGKVVQFSLAEEDAFGRQETIGKGVTGLGQTVIKRLLNKDKGRRILIDVGGMSLKSREWYYKYIKEQRFYKDTIPIIASNVGISGLSKRNSAYVNTDEKVKSQSNRLNHRHANLCEQDVKAIIESEGLIGLSLDRDKLMGKFFQTEYDAYMPGTSNHREVAINAIVSNLCAIVHSANSIEAWEYISLSTEFDTHTRHLDEYTSSKDMYRLSKDLLTFFENPRATGVYDEKEIKTFMGDYTPEQIVDMITHKNAVDFLQKNLPQIYNKP